MKTPMKSIIALTFLMFTSTVIAQEGGNTPRNAGQGKPGAAGQRSLQGVPVVENFMRALRQLNLSDVQKEDIRAVMHDLKTDIAPIMSETNAGHLQLKELILTEPYDEDAVAELAAKEGDLTAERMVIAGRAISEMYDHLTDEQRVQLNEMAESRMVKRSMKRSQRGEKK